MTSMGACYRNDIPWGAKAICGPSITVSTGFKAESDVSQQKLKLARTSWCNSGVSRSRSGHDNVPAEFARGPLRIVIFTRRVVLDAQDRGLIGLQVSLRR